MVRKINHKKEQWYYYHNFTPAQVLNTVHVAEIDHMLWFNTMDGRFIHIIEPIKLNDKDEAIRQAPQVLTRTLQFVYDNMTTGYDTSGNPVCHRKSYIGRHRSPLKGARIVPKTVERKKRKNGKI